MSEPIATYAPGDLAGKVICVTGAGSRGDGVGNGRAISRVLASAGANLLLLDSNRDWLEATADFMEDRSRVLTRCVDVTTSYDVRQALSDAVQRFGSLHGLVNNVGITGPAGTAIDVDEEEWAHGFNVNVTSAMIVAKHAIPLMVAGGAIVNLGSVAGMVGGHPSLLYPMSKGAVIAMTKAMAAHHGKDGIRVNCVSPGFVYTPMVATRGMGEEERDARRQRSLLGSEGTAWDVANAVAFLLSGCARWITGINLPVDAGATAGMGIMPVPPSRPATVDAVNVLEGNGAG